MVKFQIRSEGCRAVSVGSPIRFFDPILNNALALRASQNCEYFQIPQKSSTTKDDLTYTRIEWVITSMGYFMHRNQSVASVQLPLA